MFSLCIGGCRGAGGISRPRCFLLLLVCATPLEQNALPEQVRSLGSISVLICGVGPVEATLSLTRFLAGTNSSSVTTVINFGVGGAYPGSGLSQLDICFADREVLGDLAVCTREGMAELPDSLPLVRDFSMEKGLLAEAEQFCHQHGYPFRKGPFTTVCCTSGTAERGRVLRAKYNAVCENMEGAALARVCREFGLPFLELRAISNMVEERDLDGWQLEAAADRAAAFTAEIALYLLNSQQKNRDK